MLEKLRWVSFVSGWLGLQSTHFYVFPIFTVRARLATKKSATARERLEPCSGFVLSKAKVRGLGYRVLRSQRKIKPQVSPTKSRSCRAQLSEDSEPEPHP